MTENIQDACSSYRPDFGLLNEHEQSQLVSEAIKWKSIFELQKFNKSDPGHLSGEEKYLLEFREKIRNDALLSSMFQQGRHFKLNETEILRGFVLTLLNLKDECFQKKVDELMNSNQLLPLTTTNIQRQRN